MSEGLDKHSLYKGVRACPNIGIQIWGLYGRQEGHANLSASDLP